MKHKTLTTAAMLGLFLTLAVASVHAQSANRIQVNIPFNFAAGGAKLKAGNYIVERLSMERLAFASVDGKTKAFVLAPLALQRQRNPAREKLVFQRYGDQYFLSEVWISRGTEGNGLYPSGAETRAGKRVGEDEHEVAIRRDYCPREVSYNMDNTEPSATRSLKLRVSDLS